MKIFHLSIAKGEILILFLIEKVHILRVEYAIVGVRFFKKMHLQKEFSHLFKIIVILASCHPCLYFNITLFGVDTNPQSS